MMHFLVLVPGETVHDLVNGVVTRREGLRAEEWTLTSVREIKR